MLLKDFSLSLEMTIRAMKTINPHTNPGSNPSNPDSCSLPDYSSSRAAIF